MIQFGKTFPNLTRTDTGLTPNETVETSNAIQGGASFSGIVQSLMFIAVFITVEAYI